jgi:ribosomal protein L37AE/L43A
MYILMQEKETYECPVCGLRTTHYPYLCRHVKRKHNLAFCPICGKKVKRLLTHAYYCYICGNILPEEHLKLWLLLRRTYLRSVRKYAFELACLASS